MKITVETNVAAPIETIWEAYTTPEHIKQWNAASEDWHTTSASVDLREGGTFSSRIEAKDGSMGLRSIMISPWYRHIFRTRLADPVCGQHAAGGSGEAVSLAGGDELLHGICGGLET